MQKNILMLHGNGGTSTRFLPFLDNLKRSRTDLEAHIPKLSGFESRPLPKNKNYWDLFLNEIEETVNAHTGDWYFYGHGIGGSLLLELASRQYVFPSGNKIIPKKVILHSCIGASLQHRFFPKLMKPMPIRKFIKILVYFPPLQSYWEKKLFLMPEKIPQELKDRFFNDYKHCAAFEVFFDLITPKWYKQVLTHINQETFIFLWGDKERVVASKYLAYWKNDFPKATFITEPGWDHFPMLDTPDEFFDKIITLLDTKAPQSLQ